MLDLAAQVIFALEFDRRLDASAAQAASDIQSNIEAFNLNKNESFKAVSLNEYCCGLIHISVKFIPSGPINYNPPSVQIMVLYVLLSKVIYA